MNCYEKLPMSCAAATTSIADHIRSRTPQTTNGTTSLPKSRKRVSYPRNARLVEFKGRYQTLRQWAAEMGVTYACIQSRVKFGTPLDLPPQRSGRPKGYSPQAAKGEKP
jgi:hypothetical protein